MSGQRRRGPMGGRGMRPTEKAKDFKGAMGKLFRYMGRYKLRFVMVFIFAIAGTIFNIAGPKILGKATTELYTGLVVLSHGKYPSKVEYCLPANYTQKVPLQSLL